MSVLFLQFGDFEEALRRKEAGGPEGYREQWRTLDVIGAIAEERSVCVASICDRAYDETPRPGLRLLGLDTKTAFSFRGARALFAETWPDRFILRGPLIRAALWARLSNTPMLASFADIFPSGGGFRRRLVNRAWRALLSGSNAPCASNHSLNASRSLVDALGMDPRRVVPWDRAAMAPDPEPKTAPGPGLFRLFYVGMLSEAKGVGDCLEALALLRAEGVAAEGEFVGGGDLEAWRARAAGLGLGGAVRFPGQIPNTEVRGRMRAADVVVVPSRHEYAEGLPNSIAEGLGARVPLIVSDHPSFAGRLRDGRDGLVFRAGDPAALAGQVRRLAEDSALYAALSRDGARALPGLVFGMDWAELYRRFIDDPLDRTGWVAPHSLATLLERRA